MVSKIPRWRKTRHVTFHPSKPADGSGCYHKCSHYSKHVDFDISYFKKLESKPETLLKPKNGFYLETRFF